MPHQNFCLVSMIFTTTLKHLHILKAILCTISRMAPSATGPEINGTAAGDSVVSELRKTLTHESNFLALRFRALFSLKHLACLDPPTEQTIPAIKAIAAAFTSPSALLKHELAYCLGQTRNMAAVPFLRRVLDDKGEDSMCRHEAAEALGALGDMDSLQMLRALRDEDTEVEVVRETCDIAVERIEWENSEQRKRENLRQRLAMSNRRTCVRRILIV